MQYFFTADQHFGHANIIKYCNRPFENIETMDDILITNFNEVVSSADITIHAGDFSLYNDYKTVNEKYIKKLNGQHVFLMGSHDKWLPKSAPSIWHKTIEGEVIICCHYAMRVWHRSHYNSWQLYGHSHGKLEPTGKQWDVGVDNNRFFPVSFEQIRKIMRGRPDNFNLVRNI